MTTRPQITLLTVLALTALLAGCRAGARPAGGMHLIVFLDLSGSVSLHQRARWQQYIDPVLAAIGSGSAIEIFPIHDQTGSAAPLFIAEIPQLSDDAALDELSRFKAVQREARAGAHAAFQRAVSNPTRARGTDVFGAIDRVRPDAARTTRVVFFSDMLNAARELNMERAGAISRGSMPARVRQLAANHEWDSKTLSGVEIYCVLSASDSGTAGSPIDVHTLHAFYQTLFQSLGARLMLFDTHINGSAWLQARVGANE